MRHTSSLLVTLQDSLCHPWIALSVFCSIERLFLDFSLVTVPVKSRIFDFEMTWTYEKTGLYKFPEC